MILAQNNADLVEISSKNVRRSVPRNQQNINSRETKNKVSKSVVFRGHYEKDYHYINTFKK